MYTTSVHYMYRCTLCVTWSPCIDLDGTAAKHPVRILSESVHTRHPVHEHPVHTNPVRICPHRAQASHLRRGGGIGDVAARRRGAGGLRGDEGAASVEEERRAVVHRCHVPPLQIKHTFKLRSYVPRLRRPVCRCAVPPPPPCAASLVSIRRCRTRLGHAPRTCAMSAPPASWRYRTRARGQLQVRVSQALKATSRRPFEGSP
jgi:hypothetical protein